MSRPLKRIVLHTSASPLDLGVEELRTLHLNRGWRDIGYHYVIRLSGVQEVGRPLAQRGAHVKGHNQDSIGICFAGHGDQEPWTPGQWIGGMELLLELCVLLELGADAIIGHRELNPNKTCPGTQVDLDAVRGAVATYLSAWRGN